MDDTILARNKKNRLTLIVISIFPFILYGCNTMEGLGTDIEHAGKTLDHSAEKNKGTVCCPYCSCPIKCKKS